MNSFLFKIASYRFLDAVKPIGVLFVLLFAQQGITPFQTSILICIWSATQLLLEVPLGTVADKYSRRNLLLLGLVIHMLGFVLWLGGTFWHFALGFALWGVKGALTSGTLEAFIYDELKQNKRESEYEAVNGRLESVFWTAITVSVILGGLLGQFGYQIAVVASIVTTFLACIPLIAIPQAPKVRSTGEVRYLQLLNLAFCEVRQNKKLLYIIIFFCIIFAPYSAADEYWPLIYGSFGMSGLILSILLACGYLMFIVAGASLKFVDKLPSFLKDNGLIVLGSFLLIAAGLFKSLTSIPLIIASMYVLKIAHLKTEARYQHATTSKARATVTSLKSLMYELCYLGFVLVFGFIGEALQITSIIWALGVTILVSLLFMKVVWQSGKSG